MQTTKIDNARIVVFENKDLFWYDYKTKNSKYILKEHVCKYIALCDRNLLPPMFKFYIQSTNL